MAIALVGSEVQVNSGASKVSSQAITVPSTTAGNLLVMRVAIYHASLTPGTVSFPAGWTAAEQSLVTSAAACDRAEIWYYKNNPGSITSVTVTLTGNAAAVALSFHELSGANTTAPLDTGNIANASTGTAVSVTSSGSIAATTDWVDGIVASGVVGGSGNTYTAATGFTRDGTDLVTGNAAQSSVQHNASPSAGAQTFALTQGRSTPWAAAIACWKVAAGTANTNSLTGSTSLSATLKKAAGVHLTGSESASAVLKKAASNSISRSTSLSATLIKAGSKSLTGLTALSATLVKYTTKVLTGLTALNLSTRLTNFTNKGLVGLTSLSASFVKAGSRSLAGLTSLSALLVRFTGKGLTASQATTTTLVKSATTQRTGQTDLEATLSKSSQKQLGGVSALSGSVVRKAIAKFLGDTLSAIASFLRFKPRFRVAIIVNPLRPVILVDPRRELITINPIRSTITIGRN